MFRCPSNAPNQSADARNSSQPCHSERETAMKRFLLLGFLTVFALALTERPASAWVNSRFSIGLNWHLQSANNSVLWGLWRNGQIPGPDVAPYPPPGPVPVPVGPPGA